jgi:hypothetical protein
MTEITSHCFDGRPLHQHRQISSKPSQSSSVAMPRVLNLWGAIRGFDTEMDRADAIRLLQVLAAAGMDTGAPRANVWVETKALEIGLEGGQFVSALAYAGSEGWLADAPRRG